MQQGGEGVQELQQGSEDVGQTSEPLETGGNDGQTEETADSGPETPHETVERIFREHQEKDTGDDSTPEAPEGAVLVKQAEKAGPEKAQKPEGFKIPPPARLSAAEKELFNSMPEPMQRRVHMMFKQHEGLLTRQNQQLHAEIVENQQLREAVRPYLQQHPELMGQGYTESKFVAALVAAHQRLSDPKTFQQTWLEIGQQGGIPAEVLSTLRQQIGGQGGAVQSDITQHPQFLALQQKLAALESESNGAKAQAFESTVSGIVEEMEAARNEQDGAGRYLYPELHDDAFLTQAKPLVSALVGAIPGITYGDALKRACLTLRGQQGNSTQVNQARFPAQNEQTTRAQQAAVSVRGRSAPQTPGDSNEIPPEALKSPHASVQWALNQLRRGA